MKPFERQTRHRVVVNMINGERMVYARIFEENIDNIVENVGNMSIEGKFKREK